MLDHEGLEQVVRKTMRRLGGSEDAPPGRWGAPAADSRADSQADRSASARTSRSHPTLPSSTETKRTPGGPAGADARRTLVGAERAVAVLRAIRPDLSLRQAQALLGMPGGGGEG